MADPDAHPRVTWCDGELLEATCPVCADAERKPAVLQVTTLGAERRVLTLVSCATCSLRFFPALRDPISFSEATEAAAIVQFELAIGLHGSVDCLARIDVSRVRRFLDVGCGTGLTLDWARHMYGWEVLGVDTSAMARIATREIGVPIVHGLLGQTDAVADAAWDLVFACEVIEHVTDPAVFLRAIRTALTPAGVFLMRTPSAEGLDCARPEGAIVASLSPGYHTMIHTATSLRRTLRAAGFTHVEVLRDGDTLHAAASAAPFGWTAGARIDGDELARYLRERASALPQVSAVRLGLLQQLANHTINAGDGPAARSALEDLGRSLEARHGAGLDASAGDVPGLAASIYCAAFMTRAMLARLDGDLAGAEERFAAAAAVAGRGIELLRSVNGLDPGLEVNRRLAEQARVSLVAARDPAGAVELARSLFDEEGSERAVLGATLLIECLAGATYDVARGLRSEVEASLAAGRIAPKSLADDARWALAMMLLHHEHDYAQAAVHFAAAGQEATAGERRWSARFHEAYAVWYGGDRVAAGPLLHAVLAEAERPAGDAAAWAEQARSLLAHSG